MAFDEKHPGDGAIRTCVDLLRVRSRSHPFRETYQFLSGGNPAGGVKLRALDLRARAVGAALARRKLRGKNVLIALPHGPAFLEAIFGCLYAGAVAVPASLQGGRERAAELPRFRAIARDCEPAAVLTRAELPLPRACDGVRRIDLDSIDNSLWKAWEDPGVRPRDVAFILYTSGIAAVPRGVLVPHSSCLSNAETVRRCFEVTENDRAVSWMPFDHAMGLMSGVLQPLYVGCEIGLMSAGEFFAKPVSWLRAMTRFRATISGGPGYAFELCAQRARRREGLDLSALSVAYCVGDSVRPETLDRFAREFAPHGFRAEALLPCYGLTESTLLVAGRARGAGAGVQPFESAELEHDHVASARAPQETAVTRVVSDGPWNSAQKLVIVDPKTLLQCPPGTVGEIWLASSSVCKGYWNRPEETERVFRATLGDGTGPFLRTGDVGFLHDGELFVLGRKDETIIVNGRRHYAEEIERTVAGADPGIREGRCVVFVVREQDREEVVVVAESRGQASEESTALIRRAIIARHELMVASVVLLDRGSVVPLSAGRVCRRECRRRYLSSSLRVAHQWRKAA